MRDLMHTMRGVRAGRITTHCAACRSVTKGGKRYCADHLTHLPYPARLMAEQEAAAAEVDHVVRLLRKGCTPRGASEHIDPTSLVSREVLLFVRQEGMRTARRLARDVDMVPTPEVGLAYGWALERAGKVRVTRTRGRRVWVLEVTGE